MRRVLADDWLRVARPVSAPRVRLLCFPYAGAGSTIFHGWERLRDDIEVCAVQLPGRQERLREPGITAVPSIVEHLFEAIASLRAAPVALYGHSFGALLAFEVSRRLAAAGRAPIALVVGARPAPFLQPSYPPMHKLPHDAFLNAIHTRFGTPLEVLRNEELMELALPALRADLTALETYVFTAGSSIDVPITALRGRLDRASEPAAMQAWQEVTSRPLTLRETDAGHFFVDTHRAWVQTCVTDAIDAVTK